MFQLLPGILRLWSAFLVNSNSFLPILLMQLRALTMTRTFSYIFEDFCAVLM